MTGDGDDWETFRLAGWTAWDCAGHDSRLARGDDVVMSQGNEGRSKIKRYPNGKLYRDEAGTFSWVLCHVVVEGEIAPTPVTLPVPLSLEGPVTLESVVNDMASSGFLVTRIGALYGDAWLAGRSWSLAEYERITTTRAISLFPDDPFAGGRVI